ncbi:hypothetical protein L6452_37460 [Arctium lappa]|uniref:Uncharacterized protein n=1 Tax=Arctium lappa TaxID=4217 RepID=A0ACB8Y2E2_ARCLA|nr:hypothetical protein L6452_37460 [Arctium lappa]
MVVVVELLEVKSNRKPHLEEVNRCKWNIKKEGVKMDGRKIWNKREGVGFADLSKELGYFSPVILIRWGWASPEKRKMVEAPDI